MSDPGQPSNPYQPSPPPGGGGWGPPPDHPQATLILVLGVLAIALCQVLGPVAWVMGGRARKEIESSGGAVGGSTQVTVGWALGIAGTALLALFVLLVVGMSLFVGLLSIGTLSTTL